MNPTLNTLLALSIVAVGLLTVVLAVQVMILRAVRDGLVYAPAIRVRRIPPAGCSRHNFHGLLPTGAACPECHRVMSH